MTGRTVVVLTREDDVTADLVVRELDRRGVPVFRFDTAWFPTSLVLTGELGGGRWTGGLRTPHRVLDFDDVTAVYYRRPTGFDFPAMAETDREWAHTEAVRGFGGVFASLPATWVNHPHALARAEYKPYQLAQAAAVGLDVPDTLVTNDPARAHAFAAAHPGGVVFKPLSGPPATWPPVTLFTTPVTVAQAGDPAVAATAHLFQERVDKAYEVRLTVVDRQVFAARIDAASEASRVDWRADADALTYRVIDPPGDVRLRAVALTERLGLLYGAFDFAVTPSGEWRFFEVNPNGQWGWIPQVREPITMALADLLQKGTQ